MSLASTFALLPSVYTDSLTVDPTGKYAYVLAGSGGSNGARTNAESIDQFTVGADGSLTQMTMPIIATNIASGFATRLVMDASGQYAYVAGPTTAGASTSNALYIYAVGANGSLSLISTTPVAADITGITVNAATNTLYTAVGGGGSNGSISLTAYHIGSNGLLTTIASPLSIPSSVVAGDIVIDPTGKYCYVTVLGARATTSTTSTKGSVYEYTIGATGALTSMSTPFLTAAGTTPRLAIDAASQYAYVLDVYDNAISQYSISANGVLTPLSTPTIASTPAANSITANPAGGSMFVTSSGTGYITTYSIGTDGSLTAAGTINAPNQNWANMPLITAH